MKKALITLIIVILSVSSLIAQSERREKLKAYKTAFITEKLELTPAEAEKFWPVYNIYENKVHQLKIVNIRDNHKKVREKGGIDALTDTEANTMLNQLVLNDDELAKAKTKFYEALKNIISSKKILKLYRAEHEFNRKLLAEFRKKQMMEMRNKKP
ncbi:MAG: sensor of ECF-type sigma factor [Bacteroidota bacterium]